jgi:hypothetical protein
MTLSPGTLLVVDDPLAKQPSSFVALVLARDRSDEASSRSRYWWIASNRGSYVDDDDCPSLVQSVREAWLMGNTYVVLAHLQEGSEHAS